MLKRTKCNDIRYLISRLPPTLQYSRHCDSGVRTNMESNGTQQSPEIDPHIHIQLIFNKGKETKMGNNNPEGYPSAKRKKGPLTLPYIKMISKYETIELNIRAKPT